MATESYKAMLGKRFSNAATKHDPRPNRQRTRATQLKTHLDAYDEDRYDGSMNLYERMNANPNVRVKETLPGVFACNFTRKAFTKDIWDNETTKARGLFIDSKGNVLARGFDKFFGLDDWNGPTTEEYLKNVQYPVRVTTKENGYLIIISSINGELTFLSKSGVTDYSRHAEEFFKKEYYPETLGMINFLLKELNASLLVEFVDPFMDPHIVLYDSVELYLLAVVRNSEEYEVIHGGIEDVFIALGMGQDTYPYGSTLTKPNGWVVYDEQDLNDNIEKFKNSDLEGCVLMDATGYMAKVKSNHYKSVKSHRSALNAVITKGEVNQKAQKVMNALALSNMNLNDYVVSGISGGTTIDLPRLVDDIGIDVFTS